MIRQFIEQVEAYLEGRLSRDELEREASALGIKNLEEEIQWVRDVQVAVEAEGLRDQLSKALADSEKETSVRRFRPMRAVLAAAASVAVLVIGFWIWNQMGEDGLYAQYEYVDPGLPVTMSETDQYELYDALTYYGEGNFEVAAEKLRALQGAEPSDTVNYFLGASLLYQGAAEAATTPLEEVAAESASVFREKAEWLLVLSALRSGDETAAAAAARDVAEAEDHPFRDKASELLNDLEE